MSPPPPTPPRLARRLVEARLSLRRDEVLDDLDGLFAYVAERDGPGRARLRYWREALNIGLFGIGEDAGRPGNLLNLMIYTNYIKMAFRTLWKRKGYSFINITGLAVGMASCILILLYVDHELGYDRFHEHGADVYRIRMDRYQGDERIFASAVTFPMVGPTMYEELPEVIDYARLLPVGGVMQHDDAQFREENLFFADSTFFTLFSYPLLSGNPETVLTRPNTMALSASTAQRYFADADPIGEVLVLGGDEYYTVTGVFADAPANSHLAFDMLLSFSTLIERSPPSQSSWGWYDFYTYVRLTPGADPEALEARLPDFMARHKGDEFADGERLLLQPLHDIHLYSDLSWEAGVNGSGTTVYFLLVIALFILVIAWVNFINLSTARSLERSLEVGVRKALGAPRSQLVRQFLLESVLVNALAAVLALGLVVLFQGRFSTLAGVSASLRLVDHPMLTGLVPAVFLIGALLSGLYPALFLSSFQPVRVLKGGRGFSGSGLWLRKGLVVFQFAASIVLIAGTLVVARQLDYLRGLDLGLNIEQTLVVYGPDVLPDREAIPAQLQTFRDGVRQVPGVRTVTAATTVPGAENFWISNFRTDRMTEEESKDIYIVGVDAAYMETFEVELLAGRFFSEAYGTDEQAFILNETASRLLGYATPEDALEGRIDMGEEQVPIIGVVGDYHHNSLKQSLDPILFRYNPSFRSYFALKMAPGNLDETLARVGDAWEEVFPGNPYEYFFLDDFFDRQYQADRQFGRVFGLFAALAIAVACLGLFGLAAFSAQQRTKEIGVRKVMGASVTGIVGLLSKEYAVLVAVANIIAWPVAYVVMERWLQTFAYHINPGVITLLVAGLAALLIAGLAVSINALRAARGNPIDALRYE